MRRRLIAIGDLHGDVHRLVRILERHEVLLPGTRRWARGNGTFELILLGDYVDWRGEKLEGDPSTWDRGSAAVLDLIKDLQKQVEEITANSKVNRSRFTAILGNHDKLMLDSFRYLRSLDEPKREAVARCHTDVREVRKALGLDGGFLSGLFGSRKKELPQEPKRLLTWLTNGGPSTIKSFGGFDDWYRRMRSDIASLIDKMPLGVIANGRLYSHSVPDDARWWQPLQKIEALRGSERDDAVEAFVWGRRIQGFDHETGKQIPKPSDAEVDRMLAGLGVQGVVVGHSLMQSLVPIKRYDGKVINIDLHGHPMSDPWLDQWEEP